MSNDWFEVMVLTIVASVIFYSKWRKLKIFQIHGPTQVAILTPGTVESNCRMAMIFFAAIALLFGWLVIVPHFWSESSEAVPRSSGISYYETFLIIIFVCVWLDHGIEAYILEGGVHHNQHRKFTRWEDITDYHWSLTDPNTLAITTNEPKTIFIRVGEAQRPVVEPLLERYLKDKNETT